MRNASQELNIISLRVESQFKEVQRLRALLETENDTSRVLKEMLAPGLNGAHTALNGSLQLLNRICLGTESKRRLFLRNAKFVRIMDDLNKCTAEADVVLGTVRGSTTIALLQ